MATSGELIEILADAVRLPTATIASYHRVLREEGLVTKGGRGRSAAQMTAADVAKLLITVMGSDNLEEASTVCRLLSATLAVEGLNETGKRITVKHHMTLIDAIMILLMQVHPHYDARKHAVSLPILRDVSKRLVVLEIGASTLEARILDEAGRILDFGCFADRVPDVHPDDWFSLPVEQRLIAKADVGGLITVRSINKKAMIRLSFALPI